MTSLFKSLPERQAMRLRGEFERGGGQARALDRAFPQTVGLTPRPKARRAAAATATTSATAVMPDPDDPVLRERKRRAAASKGSQTILGGGTGEPLGGY